MTRATGARRAGRRAGPPGFTAFELLLVVALAALLATIAVAAYETYFVRSQIAASIVLTEPLRAEVARMYRQEQIAPGPERAGEALAAAPREIDRWVAAVEILHGRIDLLYGAGAHAAIAGRRLSLTPYETVEREIVWICGNHIPEVGLEPLGFALGGPQAAQIATTIESRFLPRECR